MVNYIKKIIVLVALIMLGSAATYVYGDIALPRRDEINRRLFNMEDASGGCCTATSDLIQIKVYNRHDVLLQVPDSKIESDKGN